MTLIQKYNELVKVDYRIYQKSTYKDHRNRRDDLYETIRQHMVRVEDGYLYFIPEDQTFSGRIEKIHFKTLPWEARAYGVKHD